MKTWNHANDLQRDLGLASDHRIGNLFVIFCSVYVWAISDLFLVFWPIVYKPL